MEETENQNLRKPLMINIEKFKLSGFGIFGFLSREDIEISSILLKNMSIKITKNPGKKKNNKNQKSNFTNTLGEKIKSLGIKSFKVINADIIYFASLNSKNKEFSVNDIDLSLHNLAYNSQTMHHTIPFSLESFTIHTGKSGLFDAKNYTMTSDGINFNLADSSLAIRNFALDPKFTKTEFNNKQQYNTDWFDIKTQNILISNIHLSSLFASKKLELDHITIEKPEIFIYRDKRLPDPPFKYKPLLAGLIHKIPIILQVDSVQITEGILIYEEQSENSLEPGRIFFDPFYLTAYNISNHKPHISKNPDLDISFRGKIMGTSFLEADLKINLASKVEDFTVNGKLEKIEAISFNPILENLSDLSIKEGTIHSTEFQFTAMDDESNGSLSLLYENLQVNIDKSTTTKVSKIKSWAANGLINKNNMKSQHGYREGSIHFERDKNKGLPNYIWNSCKTGIISVIAPIADKNNKKEKTRRKKKKK
jgi:hypothetical protein